MFVTESRLGWKANTRKELVSDLSSGDDDVSLGLARPVRLSWRLSLTRQGREQWLWRMQKQYEIKATPEEQLQRTALEYLHRLVDTPEFSALWGGELEQLLRDGGANLEERLREIGKQQRDLERRTDELIDEAAKQPGMRARFNQKCADWEEQRTALQQEAERLHQRFTQRDRRVEEAEPVNKVLEHFDDIWAALDHDERREIDPLMLETAVAQQGAGEVIVRLKALFQPEQKVRLPMRHWSAHPRQGPLSLTLRQCEALYLRGQALSHSEIVRRWAPAQRFGRPYRQGPDEAASRHGRGSPRALWRPRGPTSHGYARGPSHRRAARRQGTHAAREGIAADGRGHLGPLQPDRPAVRRRRRNSVWPSRQHRPQAGSAGAGGHRGSDQGGGGARACDRLTGRPVTWRTRYPWPRPRPRHEATTWQTTRPAL